MVRRNFIVCVFFSLWTIVQTVIHLVFVIYSYYMSICEKSPTEAPTIFFYLTYLYNNECDKPVLKRPGVSSPPTLESFVFSILKSVYGESDANSLEGIVTELLAKVDLFPLNAQESSRTSVFLLCFIILDAAWIITAVALLMGTCFGIKQSLSLVYYGPWLVTTVCVSVFDAIASILFGLDISETINFRNWLKFVGIQETATFGDFDARSPSLFVPLPITPALALFTVSSRFIIIWISNWIGFFYVIKATISVYKEPFRSKPLHHSRAYSDSSPGRSQMDLDTSAARIRSWQLFYGAIDTTSSQDSKSAQSERDQNSNSRDRDAEDVEMQQARVPSVSGNVDNFYYAYPDVAENINEGNSVCLDELRSQLPWSYTAPAPEDTRRCYSQESIMLENRNKRTCRLKSDSSVSGTEL